MRLLVRGISLENLEAWQAKFSLVLELSDLYFSKDKSFLFLTVSDGQGKEFIDKFHGIKWRGDYLNVSESIFPKYIPSSTNLLTDSQKETSRETSRETTTARETRETTTRETRKVFDFLRIRNPKNRKIIKLSLNRKNRIRFNRENTGKEISVQDLTWDLQDKEVVDSDSDVQVSDLKEIFTTNGNFAFSFSDNVSTQEPVVQEEVIKSFSGNSQMFFREYAGIFKKGDQDIQMTLEKRRELTILYKKRHKDASRRKIRYFK